MEGHPCFISLTRPVMFWRVPHSYFRVNVFAALMLGVFTMKPVMAITLFLVLHGIGRIVFTVDPLFLPLITVKLPFIQLFNFWFWQCKSYDPY